MNGRPDAALVAAFAPTGRLRASINLGNPILANRGADGRPVGVSIDLAQAFGQWLGVEVAARDPRETDRSCSPNVPTPSATPIASRRNLSSFDLLRGLPALFRGGDLTNRLQWTSKKASHDLWLWKNRDLVAPLGGHSDVFANLVVDRQRTRSRMTARIGRVRPTLLAWSLAWPRGAAGREPKTEGLLATRRGSRGNAPCLPFPALRRTPLGRREVDS